MEVKIETYSSLLIIGRIFIYTVHITRPSVLHYAFDPTGNFYPLTLSSSFSLQKKKRKNVLASCRRQSNRKSMFANRSAPFVHGISFEFFFFFFVEVISCLHPEGIKTLHESLGSIFNGGVDETYKTVEGIILFRRDYPVLCGLFVPWCTRQ